MKRDKKGRFTRTKKLFKTITVLALITGATYATYWIAMQESKIISEAAIVETVKAIEVPKIEEPEKSDVEKAEQMLRDANDKLDREETMLLAEKKRVQDEAAAKIADLDAKLDNINRIRLDFTKTPGQQQSSTQ